MSAKVINILKCLLILNYYEGADSSQMAFWTCYSDRVSKKHTHEFDEIRFMLVASIRQY